MSEVLSPPYRGKVGIRMRNRPKVSAPRGAGVKYNFNFSLKGILSGGMRSSTGNVPAVVGQNPLVNVMTGREISAERQLLYFLYPCSFMKEQVGRLSTVDVRKLTAIIDEGRDPTHLYLGYCFPEQIFLFGESMGHNPLLDDPWSMEMVLDFCSRHNGPTPTVYGTVVEVQPRGLVGVKLDGGMKVGWINRYGLPISTGDLVSSHVNVITAIERRC